MSNVINFKEAKEKQGQKNREELLKKLHLLKAMWAKCPPKTVTAVLISRDGLSKTIQLPYPNPDRYYLALRTDPNEIRFSGGKVISSTDKCVREYRLVGWQDGLGDNMIAVYKECR